MPTIAGMPSGYAPSQDDGQQPTAGERGYRRKKLATMAGNLYRSGQQAVTDIREQYAQTRGLEGGGDSHGRIHIPGAFPEVSIIVQGNEQMVLFPSYAKRHIKKDWSKEPEHQSQAPHGSIKDEDYWAREWQRHEDEKAIVDVDVRGWLYAPNTGPMTRRNRMLIGLARQLSGIPAPKADQNTSSAPPGTLHQRHHEHEELREQEKIAHEAARIERKGQQEKHVAYRGGYSEQPNDGRDAESESVYGRKSRRGSQTPESLPTSPVIGAMSAPTGTSQLSEAELTVANANLMARVAPFMTNPMVALPVTLFFYNDEQSQSRTVITNDAGHFNVRAPLDFVPTNVKVLANEKLTAIQEIKIIEPQGVSLISDVDDTIKKSNISSGAREIFRNTFVRDLADLTVDGVKEWYNEMHDMGVSIHYCSNSPWQLYPVLASYFKMVGLPHGSLHLKQYSGMLQGIFEPVAERKRSTLTRLMRDFPSRKFLLVGDSGEADLEVYTDLAVANPGRILAIFIRDVTTPETAGYFDTGFEPPQRRLTGFNPDVGARQNGSDGTIRKNSAYASFEDKTPTPSGPVMGTLIDLSEEPQETNLNTSSALEQLSHPSRTVSATDLLAARKPPPPRPAKPAALRSSPSVAKETRNPVGLGVSQESAPTPPLPPRKSTGLASQSSVHPLTQMQSSSQQTLDNNSKGTNRLRTLPPEPTSHESESNSPPPPPLPRRRVQPSGMKSLSPRLFGRLQSTSDIDFEPLPGPMSGPPPSQPAGSSAIKSSRSSTRSGGSTPTGSPTLGAVNKKLELWRRRLARAQEQLDPIGVALYTWRRGQDVAEEAKGIVKVAMDEMEKNKGKGG